MPGRRRWWNCTSGRARVRCRGAGLLGLYHFAILLPDRQALGRFVTHLAEVGAHAGSADHLVSEALYLSDPDGLGIEVYADRPRASWTTSGDGDERAEIVMATEPLDLRSLVGEAGGERWTGMPAGTVIGHVHFHVGAIREAEAFYHAALGFDKTAWTYPGALFLSAGGYHHHVGTNIWAAGSPAATDRRRAAARVGAGASVGRRRRCRGRECGGGGTSCAGRRAPTGCSPIHGALRCE